ncbi:hypothetical protein BDK89_0755 [Ilumatobacter fluminis]|uniref:Fibronectin type-III domain-containing protein n=1 Tax=Ilumatobacter fluminis TaxID=467091 RepID=A0A4R7HW10_9ACTN|nr:hypothetical protein BDK89_0755 [Ilumatobacter fluminis]
MTRVGAPQRRRVAANGRDTGSVLPLVLVLMVIGALVVLPLMNYAITVMRAGEVESDKTRSLEYARAGLRTALTSTASLYDNCGGFAGDVPRNLASIDLAGVSSTCQVVGTTNYLSNDQVPFHLATLQIDQPIPPELEDPRNYTNPSAAPDDEDLWQPDRSPNPAVGTVWVPNLPVRPEIDRTTPARGDGDYSRAMSFGTCDVYFPGTYTEPVAVRGPRPTYFVSGVYYFESTITFEGGADVVVGAGETEGCTGDIDALNYVSNPPESTLISGVGATFVFGHEGQFIVDNSGGAVDVVMNQRYADDSEEGALPSDGVSIMTVNGDLDDGDPTGDVLPLFVDDVLATLPANVTVNGEIVNVADDGYVPSVHTPEPIPPEAPAAPSVAEYISATCSNPTNCADKAAAFLSWATPDDNGFVITDYVVEVRSKRRNQSSYGSWSPTPCPLDAPWATGAAARVSCTVQGLNGYSNPGLSSNESDYQFRVTAVSYGGSSDPGPESPGDTRIYARPYSGGIAVDPLLSVADPVQPINDLGSPTTNFADGKLISWNPVGEPSDSGGLPIDGYRVVATPVGPNPGGHPLVECSANWDQTSCLLPADDPDTPAPAFEGLVRGAPYRITMHAINELGESSLPPSPPPTLVFLDGLSDSEVDALPPYTPPPPPPTPAIYRTPPAIIEVVASSASPIQLDIAGYVSMPQGRIELDGGSSAEQHAMRLTGGAVTARIDVANLGTNSRIEFENPSTQKTILIVTTVNGDYDARAEAVVQVNANGGWALNSWEAE